MEQPAVVEQAAASTEPSRGTSAGETNESAATLATIQASNRSDDALTGVIKSSADAASAGTDTRTVSEKAYTPDPLTAAISDSLKDVREEPASETPAGAAAASGPTEITGNEADDRVLWNESKGALGPWSPDKAERARRFNGLVDVVKEAIQPLQSELSNMKAVEQLIENSPEQFIAQLAAAFPDKYQRFLQPQQQQESAFRQPQSLEELRAIAPALAAKYAPMERAAQSQQIIESLRPQVRAQVQAAFALPGMDDKGVRSEVLAELRRDPRASLESCYRKVYLPRIAADRTRMRGELLDELNSRPHSTASASSAATGLGRNDEGYESGAYADNSDIARAIRKSIRK